MSFKPGMECILEYVWNDTEREFMLQDLTRNDIEIYVYDKRGEDP